MIFDTIDLLQTHKSPNFKNLEQDNTWETLEHTQSIKLYIQTLTVHYATYNLLTHAYTLEEIKAVCDYVKD
jgi:hypothetical protein